MTQQTVVSWLKKELEDFGDSTHLTITWEILDELCEQAKAMEKEQIKELIELPSDEEMRKELFYQKQVMNPYPTIEYAYTAYEKGFMDCAKLIIDKTLNK